MSRANKRVPYIRGETEIYEDMIFSSVIDVINCLTNLAVRDGL